MVAIIVVLLSKLFYQSTKVQITYNQQLNPMKNEQTDKKEQKVPASKKANTDVKSEKKASSSKKMKDEGKTENKKSSNSASASKDKSPSKKL